jgi:transposase
MRVSMIGLDTAKPVFQIHGVNEAGKAELKRKLRRSELIPFFEKQETCAVVMEACGAAHDWARILTGFGHTVKLVAAETVRPFVKKGKKNDAADAAAICEAASRPDVKFVATKSAEAQAGHRTTLRQITTDLDRHRHPGPACGSIPVGQTTNDAGECHARPGNRIRSDRAERHSKAPGTHGTR